MLTLEPQSPTPKYAQLASQIKEQIAEGLLKPGDRLPSFSEMRSRFGANAATVERVFSTLERDGLIERVQGSGTFVADRTSMEVPAQNVIGLTGSATLMKSAPYWAHLVSGVQTAAQERGLQILLLGHIDENASAQEFRNLRGILICDGRAQVLAALLQKLKPRVASVSLFFPVNGFGSVSTDDFSGSRAVTEHLLQLGHRRIAFLTAGEDTVSSTRRAGYRAALREAGVTPQAEWVRSVTTLHSKESYVDMGRAAMRNWLRSGWSELGCTAIVAQNDETAIGAMAALTKAGLRVPQDVSLAGFDGTEVGTYCSPRLTSVALPLEAIGAAGMELLLEGGQGAMILPSRLVVRESTAPPRNQ